MGIVKADTFTRTAVGSGWGTATDSETWTIQSGTGQSTTGTEGKIISSSGSTFATLGSALSGADAEGLIRFQVKDTTHNTAGILLRWTDANNHWLGRFNGAAASGPSINVMVKVSGTYTSQADITMASLGITVGPTSFYWLRFRCQGTTISIKMWQDGTSEPGWSGTYTLSSQNVAGTCGLYGFASGGNANFYDSYQVDDLAGTSHALSATVTSGAGGSATLIAEKPLHATVASSAGGSASLTAGIAGTGIGDLAVTSPSVAWTGVGGSPGTATRVTYKDIGNSGWSVDLIPTYGGMPISSVQSLDSNVLTQEHSLSTTVPDGHIHWLEQNPSALFGGSEDVAFTLTEQAPIGTAFRRYYQAVGSVNDALGVAWTAYACIYPGDPGLIAYRFDLHNPGGSAISLNATDSLEVALLGGLEQSDATWAPANGGYGTIAGSDTVGWPSSLTSIEPDYVYIVPATGGNTNLGQGTVKKTSLSGLGWSSLQIQYLQNASRLKVKVQGSFGSIAAGATQTIYALQVLRRNITATDMRAIAADYLAPGTPTVTNGSYTSYSNDERAYVFAASSNHLTATLSMSGTGVTTRFKPVAKITGWLGAAAPVVTWGGVALTAGTDYRYTIDATNHILYVQLYFDVVASGAVGRQRNNAALDVTGRQVALSATVASGAGASARLTVDKPLRVTVLSAAGGSAALGVDKAMRATVATSAGGSARLVVEKPLRATLASGAGGSATLTVAGGAAVPGLVALTDALAASVVLSDTLAATVTLSDALAATVTLSDSPVEAA